MSDLINRQAILKHIEKTRQSVQMMDDTRVASIIMNGMYLCEKAVRDQPSVQLDRNRPHWIISSDGYYPYCSECKSEPKSGEMTDFCPNCGADMRGGKKE